MENLQNTVARSFVSDMIDSMINAVVVIDLEGKIQKANKSLLNLLGYRQEEIINSSINTIFAQEPNANWIKKLIEKRTSYKKEINYHSKNKTHIPVLFFASLVYDEENNIQGIICVAQDITDRKKTEIQNQKILQQQEQLKNVNQQLQLQQHKFLEKLIVTIANATPKDVLHLGFMECLEQTNSQTGILYVLDEAGIYQPVKHFGVPKKQEKKTGYRINEGLVGAVVAKKETVYYNQNKENHDLNIDNGFVTFPPPNVFFTPVFCGKDVHAVLALGSINPFDENRREICNSIVRQLNIGYDNALVLQGIAKHTKETEQRNQEVLEQQKALQQVNQQLQDVSKHKEEFLANMSHELRTPLNAIIGYSSLLSEKLKGTLSEKDYKNLTNVNRAAYSLLHIINDVLDFSKIESGKMDVFVEEFGLNSILEDCIMGAESLATDKGIELKSEIEEDLPDIESDFTKIKQIVKNLLSNAIKFTEQGYVMICAKALKNSIELKVEDTGCGIPQENIQIIFESFKQIDSSIQKRFGGAGLGLAITKKFCEMLNIKISLESEKNRGTTFVLNIPLKERRKITEKRNKTQRIVIKEITSDVIAEEELVVIEEPIDAYVVCMSKDVFAFLKDSLVDLPLEPIYIENVEQCVLKAKEKTIWVIIMEPNTTGFTALKEIKSIDTLCNIPVIMYCSKPEKAEFQLDVEYLTKPIEKKKLVDVLLRVNKGQKGDILIIDDDQPIRELYRQLLTSAGYTAHPVQNGKEAIEFLTEKVLPQTIILDLLMPQMNGFEFMQIVQKNGVWKKIPIVVVTGKDLSVKDRKMLEQGSQILLKKSELVQKDPEHLNNIIYSVIKGDIQSVLVVDDNELNLDLIGAIFQREGYMVYKANSGQEGIDMALEKRPHVIIMDLAMPGMDGFEATKILRKDKKNDEITIIACSAFASDDFRQRATDVGCEGYITKPVDPKTMVEQVKRYALISRVTKRQNTVPL